LVPEISISAVVLAAGRSSRMGRDKALLEYSGGPLWQRQRDLVAGMGVRELFLSARPDQAWAKTAPGFTAMLIDDVPEAGPLAGIARALRAASSTHLLVLAIDLPRMEPAWFARLRTGCLPARGSVGRRAGFFEPLAAIYPVSLAADAHATLARGERGLQPWVGRAVERGGLSVHDIAPDEAGWFENWNDPLAAGLASTA
jgi:molybdopterin-guanine dinucleotide biosynthesis protein A